MPRVIIEGRLHPAAIAIRTLKGLRRSAFYFALVIVQAFFGDRQGLIFVALSVPIFVLVIVGPILEYLRFSYRLTEESLYVESGVIRRRTRRIPLDRIQDVSSEAGVIHRLLGVVKLSIQTSSTAAAEADLDCLSVANAEALKQQLKGDRPRQLHEEPSTPLRADEKQLLFSVRTRDLLLRGLTDNRAGLIAISSLALLERGLDLQNVPPIKAALEKTKNTATSLSGLGTVHVVMLVTLSLALIFLVGWLASAVTNLLQFHGFKVRHEAGVFHRHYGLFTRRMHALPKPRIQALRIEQSLMRRIVGIAVMRTEDMGAGAHEKNASAAGTHVFVPAASAERLWSLVPMIFDGLSTSGLSWKRTAPSMVRRAAIASAALGFAVALPAGFFYGPWAALALGIPVLVSVIAWLRFRHLGWALSNGFVAVRDGVLGKRFGVAPLDRVQALVYKQNPFDRRWKVGKLSVIVGGGASLELPNLGEEEARDLIKLLN